MFAVDIYYAGDIVILPSGIFIGNACLRVKKITLIFRDYNAKDTTGDMRLQIRLDERGQINI